MIRKASRLTNGACTICAARGATNLQALGIPIEVTEAVLNHISGTRAGIAGIYNRYKYEPEKRAALEVWDKRLGELLDSEAVLPPLG